MKETKVYTFQELSDSAKETALQENYAVNVEYHEWWESTYYDAEHTALLKLTGFDIGRGCYCEGSFIESAEETAAKIMSEHGKNCDTLLTAREYKQSRDNLVKQYSDGINTDRVAEDKEYDFDNDCDELDAEFLRSILEDYRIILSKEYDYLTSEEAITETFDANNYEFTEDGMLSN
jgi:hypothetical protein